MTKQTKKMEKNGEKTGKKRRKKYDREQSSFDIFIRR